MLWGDLLAFVRIPKWRIITRPAELAPLAVLSMATAVGVHAQTPAGPPAPADEGYTRNLEATRGRLLLIPGLGRVPHLENPGEDVSAAAGISESRVR